MNAYDLKDIQVTTTPRPQQTELLEFTKDAILGNKKFIVLDAPTGTGKSVFSVMFMDWYKKNYNITAQFDLLTNSKILQEQYTNEFEFMNSLWGKASYQCDKYNCTCDVGREWAKIQNSKCEQCPYTTAKYKFENGDVALTNYHLFLTYMNYMPGAWKRSSSVLIIDEAHSFETVFCDFISTKISRPLLRRNGLDEEETQAALNVFGEYMEDLSLAEFVQILQNDFLPIIQTVTNRLGREAENGSIQSLKHLQSLANNLLKWQSLCEEYENLPSNWILETEKIYAKDNKSYHIELAAQPVWAYPYLREKIWDRYDYVIFMSGTILDKKLFCQMNDLDYDSTVYKALDSPFPLKNRPIYFFNKIGKQTYATKEIVWPKQKEVLEKILKKYKSSKGIIHTANYQLQQWVVRDIESDKLLAHTSENRTDVVQQHYNSNQPTVLVSPSLFTGLDLKDDFSRHQTILKVPYPNLKSKKVVKRMETNKAWYSLQTVQDFVQSYGRSIRSMEDFADTYILDGSFDNVLKYSRHLFPKWVLDALHYIN